MLQVCCLGEVCMFLTYLFAAQIDSLLNVGESAYSQLDAIRTERDKSSEWERKRAPQEQSAVSDYAVFF